MNNESPQDRESRPERQTLETGLQARARREAANGIRQTDMVFATIDQYLEARERIRLRPSFLGDLNRLAVEGLTDYAGVPRPHGMTITGSGHQPPPPAKVQPLLEEFCDYVNDNWHKSAVHLAAYAMWRINWIHPYDDGNGRTARAVAYVILSLRLETRLPGRKTIVDQIVHSKGAYYRALEAADAGHLKGVVDVGQMETLIGALLAKQFAFIHAEATGTQS